MTTVTGEENGWKTGMKGADRTSHPHALEEAILTEGMDLAHVALWVSDMEASLDFYLDGLDLDRRWSWEDDGVENVYVGTDDGELQLRHDPNRTTPIAPSRADVDHVAFELADPDAVDAAFDRVADREDCSVVAEPHVVDPAGAYAAFVGDPDDYTLELVAPLD